MTIFILSILWIFLDHGTSDITESHDPRRNLFEWGTVYSGGAISKQSFPRMDCKYLNKSTCCSALEKVEPGKLHLSSQSLKSPCQITKEYYPSPYEINQITKAEEIALHEDYDRRLNLFRDFIESPQEIEHAKRWLHRVAKRQGGDPLDENNVDKYYLSRFKVTQDCPTQPKKIFWEYIEPLTVHARHPFAFKRCLDSRIPDKRIPVYVNVSLPYVSKTSVDYILLSPDSRKTLPTSSSPPSKTFLLDAGTSRFDSSLNWFVCAYQQVGLSHFFPFSPFPHLCMSACSWGMTLMKSLAGKSLYWNQMISGVMCPNAMLTCTIFSMPPSPRILMITTRH
jgi:hypothetical protein